MILVTGGSGLVGKHLKDIMPDATYIGSKDCDLTDVTQVDALMDFFRPKIVVHLAARVGNLLDNMTYPVDYLEQNVLMGVNVLKKCHEYNVDRVISILSTCTINCFTKFTSILGGDSFNFISTTSITFLVIHRF